MPWFVATGHGCPESRPWAVVKGTPTNPQEKVACHESRESAMEQVRALYASEGGKMAIRASYLTEIGNMQFDESNGKHASWVHALPIGAYKHPVYGTVDVTAGRVQRFVESVKNKVRGIEPSINYAHDNSGGAAGWVKDAEARSDGVWLFVEWVKDAATDIKLGKYKYFSAEFDDEWEDPQGNKFKDVIFGGALTNRPFMKNLVPINLSEASVDNAFELVSLISGTSVNTLKGGDVMGLSEEDLEKLSVKLAEKMGVKAPPANEPPQQGSLNLSEVTELKQLAEENPLVNALIHQLEANSLEKVQTQKELLEQRITAKLSEFDRSKIVLTPVAKQLVHKLLMEIPSHLQDDFWKVMTAMRTSNALLVELGERAGARVNYGEEKSAKQRFSEATGVLMAKGMSYPDAVQKVAEENPALYDEYRNESFAFRTTGN